MDKPIETECIYTTDPPSVGVFVLGIAIGQFDLNQYNRIKDVLGLPDVVCDGPTSTG